MTLLFSYVVHVVLWKILWYVPQIQTFHWFKDLNKYTVNVKCNIWLWILFTSVIKSVMVFAGEHKLCFVDQLYWSLNSIFTYLNQISVKSLQNQFLPNISYLLNMIHMHQLYTRISFEIMQAEVVTAMLCILCNKSIPFNLVQYYNYTMWCWLL